MKIKDLQFEPFISEKQIRDKIRELAKEISADYQEKCPVFLPVLNGSFVFAAELIRQVDVPCKVSFVKVSSYMGTHTTGQMKTLIGLEESLFNQHVVIVEDIIDTGLTLKKLEEDLRGLGAKTVEVAALLRKLPARENRIQARYVGFDIESEFVLGYGLDYEGLGRNLSEIYKAVG